MTKKLDVVRNITLVYQNLKKGLQSGVPNNPFLFGSALEIINQPEVNPEDEQPKSGR